MTIFCILVATRERMERDVRRIPPSCLTKCIWGWQEWQGNLKGSHLCFLPLCFDSLVLQYSPQTPFGWGVKMPAGRCDGGAQGWVRFCVWLLTLSFTVDSFWNGTRRYAFRLLSFQLYEPLKHLEACVARRLGNDEWSRIQRDFLLFIFL